MPGDESQPVGQNEIDELLKQAAAAKPPASTEQAPAAADAGAQALSQDDVEALLAAAQGASAARPTAPPASPPSGAVAAAAYESPIAADDIELLLSHAERALASAQQPASPDLPQGVKPFRFEDFGGAPASTEAATIELIRDVELDLKIELGRTQMYLEDVLKLRKGSVVPLDKLAGDPVDIYVNGRLIARGEVLVLNDNFCVRVAELISGDVAAAG